MAQEQGRGGDWQRDVLRRLGQTTGEPRAVGDTGVPAGADGSATAAAPGGAGPNPAATAPTPGVGPSGAPGAGAPGVRRGEPALRLVHPPRPGAQPSAAAPPAGGGEPAYPAPPLETAEPAPAHPEPQAAPAPVRPAPSPALPHPARSAAAGGGHPGDSPVPRGSRDPRLPESAPEAVPTVDPRLARALGRPQHGDSLTRRTGRSLRRLTASAAQDVTEETRIARELQQPVTTGRVIAVTSIRGGVGKSTVSALLGRTFNHYRHDPVLTLEADAALGTLPVRMGAESVRWACGDLAPILSPSMRLNDVTGYLVPVADGGWLLPASRGRVGAPLDVPTYRTVTLALRRYFAVTVVDCESLPGEVARTAMDTAHARVVVAPTTAEGVNGTRQVLNWLAQLPHAALASTVVALTAGSPDLVLDVKAAVAHLKETGVTVVPLPYDRHLAGGGPIRPELLGQATRDATVRLAAEAMRRATRVR
ncbi:hypothetical protein ACIPJS_27290 [Streptomyces sp. NPDC086783]|uniref:hypothetical protein n=1 Tax=Streptomyces sp. NPDC086783 TaxID=3365758 RepID=UPI00380C54FA